VPMQGDQGRSGPKYTEGTGKKKNARTGECWESTQPKRRGEVSAGGGVRKEEGSLGSRLRNGKGKGGQDEIKLSGLGIHSERDTDDGKSANGGARKKESGKREGCTIKEEAWLKSLALPKWHVLRDRGLALKWVREKKKST